MLGELVAFFTFSCFMKSVLKHTSPLWICGAQEIVKVAALDSLGVVRCSCHEIHCMSLKSLLDSFPDGNVNLQCSVSSFLLVHGKKWAQNCSGKKKILISHHFCFEYVQIHYLFMLFMISD